MSHATSERRFYVVYSLRVDITKLWQTNANSTLYILFLFLRFVWAPWGWSQCRNM